MLYLVANVTNRGNAPTSITHMVILDYPTWAARWLPWRMLRLLNWHQKQFFITNTGIPGPPPYHLEQGGHWVGMARYTDELEAMIAAGRLYVGIHRVTPEPDVLPTGAEDEEAAGCEGAGDLIYKPPNIYSGTH